MASQVVQIPVLKQGAWDKGSWSTRILTLDIATGTATISRRSHPKNILYHAMELELVQMWPHFAQRDLEDYINCMESKMTLRLIGKAVPVPDLSTRQVVTETALAAAGAAGPHVPESSHSSAAAGSKTSRSGDYRVIAGDGSKQQRSVDAKRRSDEVWMIRFTTYQSYELALVMVSAMRGANGQPGHLLSTQAERDLRVIHSAWMRCGGAAGLNAETAKA